MRKGFITFRSVTYAQRGESVLKKGRIRCHLQRTPRWMEEQGCGYSLELGLEDLAGASYLLRQNGVPFRRLYRKGEQGDMEEVVL